MARRCSKHSSKVRPPLRFHQITRLVAALTLERLKGANHVQTMWLIAVLSNSTNHAQTLCRLWLRQRRVLSLNHQRADFLAGIIPQCVPVLDVGVCIQEELDKAGPVVGLEGQAPIG